MRSIHANRPDIYFLGLRGMEIRLFQFFGHKYPNFWMLVRKNGGDAHISLADIQQLCVIGGRRETLTRKILLTWHGGA